MEALEEQLRNKTAELEELRRTFDDFVESSKELEAEFDKSLAASERELNEKAQKLTAAEDTLRLVREECNRLRKDSGALQAELSSAKARVAHLEEAKRLLESQNEDFSNRVRILEASEEDLKRKLEEAEEDIVFLNNDLEDLKAAKLAADEEHSRLRSQVENLEARDASSSYNSAMMAAAETTIAELQAAIKEFEEREKAAKALTTTAPAAQAELEHLIASLQQQLAARSADHAALAEENRRLKDQLQQRDHTSECSDILPLGHGSSHPSENDTDVEEEPTSAPNGEQGSEEIDFAAQTLTFSQPGPAPLKLHTVSSLMTSLQPILESTDLDLIKAELRKVSERYESIRNSNSALMNKLQAIRGNILVCCRTRPASDQELSAGGKICVDAYDDVEMLLFDNRVWKSFAFDRVWKADANQVDVFADVEPMVHSVLDGFNSCILAYGQTGSGKTHTMDGTGDQHGVSYRAMQALFDQLQHRKAQAVALFRRRGTTSHSSSSNIASTASHGSKTFPSTRHSHSDFEFTNPLKRATAVREVRGESLTEAVPEACLPPTPELDEEAVFRYKVEISMMEIYNEQVYDLLHDSAGGGQTDGQSLDIRQSADNVVSVPGLKSHCVRNMEETLLVFTRGKRNRATASTNLNEHSSRSHLIIQVEVTIEEADGGHGVEDEAGSGPPSSENPSQGGQASASHSLATTSRLYLVDLAGSERIKKSGVVGNTRKEAVHINKSLLALGDVMEALDQKQKHIPYRNSKLTFLLQNALGGAARTMMVVTVCPTDLTYEETLFTLQFAQRVRNISLGPIQRTHLHSKNLELALRSAKAELKEVKKAKALLEDVVGEMKKEQKRLQEKSSTALENKLRASEEAKRGVDVLAQHLQKQLGDLTARCNDEREAKDRLASEMDLCQRNLKKALEQLKEHMLEAERMQSTLRTKERELESVRGALLRAYNASMTPTSAASAASAAGMGRHGEGETGRTSEASRVVVFSLEDKKDGQAPQTPATRASSPTKPALKQSSVGVSAAGAGPSSREKDGRTAATSLSPTSQSAAGPAPGPAPRLSFFSGTTTPQTRPAPPTQAAAPTTASRGSGATPVAKPTPTTSKSRHSTGTVTTPVSSTQRMPSGLLQDPRATSASRARPAGAANGTNTATPSPTVAKRRQATTAANPTPRSSLAAIAEGGGPHAVGVASQSSVTGSVTSKMPMLSARSEEALRRHQLRMEKRREAMANQKPH